MKKIKLNNIQLETLLDDEDYERFKNAKITLRVCSDRSKYAVVRHNKVSIDLHRLILNAPVGYIVDHIDNNGLNNQKSNLRIATHQQNHRNAPKQSGSYSSNFKGVSWNKRKSMWRAYINIKGGQIHLGYFYSELSAASAYNAAAIERFKEFASLNQLVSA